MRRLPSTLGGNGPGRGLERFLEAVSEGEGYFLIMAQYVLIVAIFVESVGLEGVLGGSLM